MTVVGASLPAPPLGAPPSPFGPNSIRRTWNAADMPRVATDEYPLGSVNANWLFLTQL